MSAELDDAAEKAATLQRLAAEAKIVAETTADPNGSRALRVVALKYKRLAEFVRTKADMPVAPINTSQILD